MSTTDPFLPNSSSQPKVNELQKQGLAAPKL